ncbi:MAG: hypothetical protein KQH57_20260 [Actinomycetales bacterium]|nr:hypothetical protein [Actinomycetales bacterium]
MSTEHDDADPLESLCTRADHGMPDMQLDPAGVLTAARRRRTRVRAARTLGVGALAVVVVLGGVGLANPPLVAHLATTITGEDHGHATATATPPTTPPAPLRTADTGPTIAPADRSFGAAVAAVAAGLGDGVVPPGFSYADSVEVDGTGATSNVYAGADGPTGPMLYLYTGISTGYVTERESGLTWQAATGFADGYDVHVATHPWSGTTWAFVDIDAADGTSVQLIGNGVPVGDLLATAHRLLAAVGRDAG